MVKQEAYDRVVDLARYLPGFLREVEELSQTARVEETELSRLYGRLDQTWSAGFIRSADLQGIKRWEALLGMKPYAGDTLEERRAAVLSRWNQQLPYSLARLKERLDAAVGAGSYELDVKYGSYELWLTLIDQTYRVMQETRDMTKTMIPANLLLIFAGKFPVTVPVDIQYSSGLELQSEYYARYNQTFLFLDGTWALDDTYKLNGYKELIDFDLYPAFLTVMSSMIAECGIDNIMRLGGGALLEETEESGLKCLGTADVSLNNPAGLKIAGQVMAGPERGSILAIQANAENLAVSSVSTAVGSSAGVEPDTVSEQIQIKSEEPVPYALGSISRAKDAVEVNADMAGTARASSGCKEDLSGAVQAGFSSGWKNGISYEHQLRVEKNLWYVDGTHLLDGSLKLNAEIINYEL